MFIYSWKQLNNRNNLNMSKYEFQEQEEQQEAYRAWKVKSSYKVHVYFYWLKYQTIPMINVT